MQISSTSVEDYISKIPEERQAVFKKMFETVNDNLPQGFEKGVSYGMVGWNVSLETFPAGYHCTPYQRCLLWEWLRRKISSPYIIWECMQNLNF